MRSEKRLTTSYCSLPTSYTSRILEAYTHRVSWDILLIFYKRSLPTAHFLPPTSLILEAHTHKVSRDILLIFYKRSLPTAHFLPPTSQVLEAYTHTYLLKAHAFSRAATSCAQLDRVRAALTGRALTGRSLRDPGRVAVASRADAAHGAQMATPPATRGSRREPSARRSIGAAQAPSGAARCGWAGGRAGLGAGPCAAWRGHAAVAVEPGSLGARGSGRGTIML